MAAVCLIPVYALLLVYFASLVPEMAVCLFSAVYRERCENPGDCVVDLFGASPGIAFLLPAGTGIRRIMGILAIIGWELFFTWP